MKDILIKIKDFCKKYKKRIIIISSATIVGIVIIAGSVVGFVYSKANGNIKYSEAQLQKIALGKVPGEVIKVDKELNFRDAVFEYKFSIKDKDNTLKEVKLDSEYGVILQGHDKRGNDRGESNHRVEIEKHGKG
ncbi:PepSY domain-containing protein [Clostridium sp. YIM B02551]|uniref:PepSY domain-containing protein n=1 Tax=Clostridium sp. YIM B02551 TaxID=2910679 RepID=UPI001EEB86B7|nr:PepSY domain-containing protein [Clostridium sp. YIM B02551]